MNITVIGAGAWGSALAVHFARHGNCVSLWTRSREQTAAMQAERENKRYFPGFPFPDALTVHADPAAALWGGGEDGLDMPNALVEKAVGLLRPGGLLVMEHAEGQAAPLRRLALKTGFVKAETGTDLAGRPRWLRARLPLDEH